MQTAVSIEEARRIEAFLYLEARLADESRYEEWENLVDEDMYYWIPLAPDADPQRNVSVTADNRKRLATRLAQLKTGVRHAQTPPSPMRRLLSNIEIERSANPKVAGAQEYAVAANFVCYELRAQSTRQLEVWPGRVEYGLRAHGDSGGLKMFLKKVMLVHASEPLPTLAFIL
ncbi:aromatic-ring-hydroxylating dioxygenase subunit beta [Aerosticca soli]|uniref:aromatic-ring-hydroxylating dioxygenase subunit beta n=1 Tax=Aerosticca soli TaxID=2010829 RepID=UPI000F82B201|nr:aromatic-ring-hydroxylating dioxygenase subunit beta [Aerosticca soli]MDI3262003.1 aromatic-ring-hydroxylating dioxygenase subunit beta [Fulvimonas sp.]